MPLVLLVCLGKMGGIAEYDAGDSSDITLEVYSVASDFFRVYCGYDTVGVGETKEDALDNARMNLITIYTNIAKEQEKSADKLRELAFSLASSEFLVKVNTNKGKTLEGIQ